MVVNTTKLLVVLKLPAGADTLMGPVGARAGTEVTIWLVLTLVITALVPPNFTLVVPRKLKPVMVTTAPVGPPLGVKPEIRGGAKKLVVLVTVPPGVVTEIGPEETPLGAVAVINVDDLTVYPAVAPLKETE